MRLDVLGEICRVFDNVTIHLQTKMPIERLPQTTIHTVASSQVLTDPRSVVKELVDNSLDAHASAIFVEISLNTIDVIQVRDNGHGIFPDDRGLVGRKHCTSKIRSLDDLEIIGGNSLGFRGEALASAAEMSGSMVVSTRIEGEVTGVSLTIGRKGEIEKEERTSQAVGTTVRIIDFFKTIPVRRQTAIKISAKHLVNIKTLLQAYALARPAVRFGIKILKAKSHKCNWSYAPMNGDGIPDAVIKAVSNKVAEHCHWKVWPMPLLNSLGFESSDEKAGVEVNESYTIEAFLPVPKCDPRIVNNVGQFISIDSRPVSCNRGTPKQIINLYKSYLTSGALTENHDKLRDPFICMNIICPSKSYDVNIEPAKDNVLFTDADKVSKAIEAFFRSVYGDLRVRELEPAKSKPTALRTRGFDVLLARKQTLPLATRKPDALGLSLATQNNEPPVDTSKLVRDQSDRTLRSEFGKVSPEMKSGCVIGSDVVLPPQLSKSHLDDDGDIEEVHGEPLSRPIRSWQSQMYFDSTEGSEISLNLQDGDCQFEDNAAFGEEKDICNMKATNPWIVAKLNAPIHRRINRGELHENLERNEQLPTPRRQVGEAMGRMAREAAETPPELNTSSPCLPTPQRRETDSSSRRRWRKGDSGGASRQHGTPMESSNGFENLDTWVQTLSKNRSINPHSSSEASGNTQNSESMPHRNRLDFMSARNLTIDTPSIAIPNAAAIRPKKSPLWTAKPGSLKNPFVSPLLDKGFRFQPQGGPNTRDATTSIQPCIDDHELMSKSDVSTPINSIHPDLASTMDYELRKQEAIQNWKASKRQKKAREQEQNTPLKNLVLSTTTSPHKNRYKKAVAALHTVEADKRNPPTPSLDPSDPRAYLIRAQQREATAAPDESPSRLRKRRKTSRLPLESLREDSIVRDLTLCLKSDDLDLKTRITALSIAGTCTDRYIATGHFESGFSSPTLTAERIRAWETNLQDLVRKIYAKDDEGGRGGVDMRIDLSSALQTHLAAAIHA